MIRRFLVLAMLVGFAAPAWPCSLMGPLPSPDALVRDAEVIARVRAEGLSSTPDHSGGTGGSPTQVRFAVLDVLKGRLPSETIEFNGWLTDSDDRNDRPVPYEFIRPGGRTGNCFALGYRAGAEYLLLLRPRGSGPSGPHNELTPYWAPLSPTNEQLPGGARDPWLAWVSQRVRTPAVARRVPPGSSRRPMSGTSAGFEFP